MISQAVSREDQLAARKRRKEELAAKKAAQKAQKAILDLDCIYTLIMIVS